MSISIKKTVAILMVLAMCTVYFAACGVKDGDVNSKDSQSSGETSDYDSSMEKGSEEGSFANSNETGSKENSATEQSSREDSLTNGSADSSLNSGVESKEPDGSSSSTPDSSATEDTSAPKEDSGNSSTPEDSSAISSEDGSSAVPPADNSSVAPPAEDSSSVAPPPVDSSSVAPPAEDSSSVAPPPVDSSSVAPPPVESSSVAPPPVESSSVAPPSSSVAPPPADSSSVAPAPESSSVAPPPVEDSSEESSYVPSSPSDPITPIPEALYADPIDSYFNQSVFVGYSIMMHFGRYVNQWRTEIDSTIMGNSVNVSAVGISFYKNSTQTPSTPDNSLPRFRGVAYNFEDLPAATGSKTMYIGLTCYSDMKYYGSAYTCPEEASAAVIAGVKKIVAENPGVNIVLISGTYNTGTFASLGSKYATRLSNSNIRKFNNYILNYCNQYGVDFIDVATPLTNGYGNFCIEYSSDDDYHIAREPFKIWIDILRDYARKKQAGTWKNITVMPTLGM